MESKQKSYHESLLRWSTRNVVDEIEGYRYTTHINVFLLRRSHQIFKQEWRVPSNCRYIVFLAKSLYVSNGKTCVIQTNKEKPIPVL